MIVSGSQALFLENVIPILWTALALGYLSLFALHWTAAVIPTVLGLTAAVLYVLYKRHQARLDAMATRPPPGRLEALLMKITRRRERRFVASTAEIEITGTGVENAIDFAATEMLSASADAM